MYNNAGPKLNSTTRDCNFEVLESTEYLINERPRALLMRSSTKRYGRSFGHSGQSQCHVNVIFVEQ